MVESGCTGTLSVFASNFHIFEKLYLICDNLWNIPAPKSKKAFWGSFGAFFPLHGKKWGSFGEVFLDVIEPSIGGTIHMTTPFTD